MESSFLEIGMLPVVQAPELLFFCIWFFQYQIEAVNRNASDECLRYKRKN